MSHSVLTTYVFEYYGPQSIWRPCSCHLRFFVLSCHLLDSGLFAYPLNFKIPGMLCFPERRIIVSNQYFALWTNKEHHSLLVYCTSFKLVAIVLACVLFCLLIPCILAHFNDSGSWKLGKIKFFFRIQKLTWYSCVWDPNRLHGTKQSSFAWKKPPGWAKKLKNGVWASIFA